MSFISSPPIQTRKLRPGVNKNESKSTQVTEARLFMFPFAPPNSCSLILVHVAKGAQFSPPLRLGKATTDDIAALDLEKKATAGG